MVIQCPKCKKQYNVDSDRITESGVKITCPGCRHQFIARRKADDKETEKRKSDIKLPKTPPCAICGVPSTHVLRGPPPRPVCEHHYQVEKEKESRFWDNNEGFVPPGVDDSKTKAGPPSPGQIRAVPPSPSKSAPAATQPKAAVPPPDAEPAFESFDDFDFFDDGGGAPKAKKQSAKEASFDFDDEAFGRPDEKGVSRPPAPAPAGPRQDFGSRDIDFASPPAPTPASTPARSAPPASPAPKAPPAPRKSQDPFSELAGPPVPGDGTPAEPGAADEFKRDSANLDGSPADERYSDFDDMESSFAWKPPAAASASAGPTTLDSEMSSSLELAHPMAPALPPPSPTKKSESEYRPAKLAKPRSARSALILVVLLGVFLAGSAFLSLTSAADRSVRPDRLPEDRVRPWHGRLEVEVTSDASAPGAVMTADLKPEITSGPAAAEAADKAWRALLPDTRAALDQALAEVEAALAGSPQSPDLLSLKVSILALRESQDAHGNTSLAGKEALAAFNAAGPELREAPTMIRAHAHALLNTGKTDAALEKIGQFLATNRNDPLGLFIKGQALRHMPQGDAAEAAAELDRAVAAEPDFIRARWELARLLEQAGRREDAASQYREILAGSPDRPGAKEARERLAGTSAGTTAEEPVDAPGETTPPPEKEPDKVKPEPKPKGIGATGSEVSDNIKDSIKTVDQYVRRYRKPGSTTPNIPRPPEEGPAEKPRPPEEGPP